MICCQLNNSALEIISAGSKFKHSLCNFLAALGCRLQPLTGFYSRLSLLIFSMMSLSPTTRLTQLLSDQSQMVRFSHPAGKREDKMLRLVAVWLPLLAGMRRGGGVRSEYLG